jgi:hypothetical protein
MIDIKHEDSFNITGRGKVFTVDLKKVSHESLLYLANLGLGVIHKQEIPVRIDDKVWNITGIERFAMPLSIVAHKSTVGLLVKQI